MLDINEIKKIIPHRYPFLLVDQIIELEEEKRAVGIKNVTINEPFFQGHFPDYPVMPGVLIVEALAQVGAVAMLKKKKIKESWHCLPESTSAGLKGRSSRETNCVWKWKFYAYGGQSAKGRELLQ